VKSFWIEHVMRATVFTALTTLPMAAMAAPVYLNAASGVTVSLGDSHDADVLANPTNGPFQNLNIAASLANVIDAPTATSPEFHRSPSTHVWVSGGHLELVFDFGAEYDLSTMHFWNYHSESYDVDEIVFTFYDDAWALVGSLTEEPRLGNTATSTRGSPARTARLISTTSASPPSFRTPTPIPNPRSTSRSLRASRSSVSAWRVSASCAVGAERTQTWQGWWGDCPATLFLFDISPPRHESDSPSGTG